jgi:signal transduction histidine kinase
MRALLTAAHVDRWERVMILTDPELAEALEEELAPRFAATTDPRFAGPVDVILATVAAARAHRDALRACLDLNPEALRFLLTCEGESEEGDEASLWELGRPAGQAMRASWIVVRFPPARSLVDIVREALLEREIARRLSSSMLDALAAAGIDDELAGRHGIDELADVLVRRCQALRSVTTCVVLRGAGDAEHPVNGFGDWVGPPRRGEWEVREPLPDGDAVAVARGTGIAAAEVVRFMFSRAARWASAETMAELAERMSTSAEARNRLLIMSRQATVGATASVLVQQLASLVQAKVTAENELADFVRAHAAPGDPILEAVLDVRSCSQRVVALFRALRTFLASSQRPRRCTIGDVVTPAVTLTGAAMRVAEVAIAPLPGDPIVVDEQLAVQAVVAILRNAMEASGPGGHVRIAAHIEAGMLHLAIDDDGPGVSETARRHLFHPFFTTKPSPMHSGLGLAAAAEILRQHGGKIAHQPLEGGGAGARFVLSFPLAEG